MGKNYCSNCGAKLEDSDEFCSECGTALNVSNQLKTQKNTNFDSKKLIFIAIGIVVILFVGFLLVGSMGTGVPLETVDFEIFEISLPEGSNFEQYNSMGNLMPIFENTGAYSEDISGITISDKPIESGVASDLIEEKDNMKLYTVDENSFIGKNGGTGFYSLMCEQDGLYFKLDGENPNLLKEVAQTIVVK